MVLDSLSSGENKDARSYPAKGSCKAASTSQLQKEYFFRVAQAHWFIVDLNCTDDHDKLGDNSSGCLLHQISCKHVHLRA